MLTERHLGQQRYELFVIPPDLLAAAGVATSNIKESKGYNSVQVHVRANTTFTVRVFQSIDGINWSLGLDGIENSIPDPFTPADQVVLFSVPVESIHAMVTITNTGGAPMLVYQSAAYLIPHGGAGGAGGGGVGGIDNVVGGSGAVYPTIAAAIAGETPFSATEGTYVPQAGSTPGVLVGPGAMNAADDFYKDWYVLNQSGAGTTPGMVSQFARVSSYVGATRTLTLDKPLNFVADTAFLLIKPVYVSLLKDRPEDVTLTGPPIGVVLELTGHRLEGRINVVSSRFVRVTNGDVSNGIEWTGDGGALWLENCNVSRRDETIYAVLVRPFTLHGRVVASSCDFYGRVAGRMGQCGWEIQNCHNWGVQDTANGVPYALVEAIGGAIALTQFDAEITSEFSGAFLYTESAGGTITGAAAYFAVEATIMPSLNSFVPPPNAAQRIAVARVQGAGALAVTLATGTICINGASVPQRSDTAGDLLNYGLQVAMLAVQDSTGVCTLTVNDAANFHRIGGLNQGVYCGVTVEGTVAMTGTATLAGSTFIQIDAEQGSVRMVDIRTANITGTIVNSLAHITRNASGATGGHIGVYILASQTAGAPVVTVSGFQLIAFTEASNPFATGAGVSVSVGTWTYSSFTLVRAVSTFAIALGGGVSGGTWTMSALVTMYGVGEAAVYQNSHAGTGGTLTVSGAVVIAGGRYGTLLIANSTGAGGTVVTSGGVTMRNAVITTTNAILARSTTATSTARAQGTITFAGCVFETAITLVAATVAGGVAEGPTTLAFENCDFRGALTDRTATGTITWAAASLAFKNTHIEGLVTFLGTSFTTVEAIETRFNGNAVEKSITATGTRPTIYRFWACSYAARFDDLLPESIDVYDVLPAAAALVRGQPVTNNAANQYVVCVAGSIVRGTSLDAPAGAASRVVAVRAGRIFAAVNAAVANGDNLGLDLVTPTQYTVSAFVPSQNAGFALEAAGATVAGKAYAQIDQR